VGRVYLEADGLNRSFPDKRFQRMPFLQLLFFDVVVQRSINIVGYRKAFQVRDHQFTMDNSQCPFLEGFYFV